MFTKQGYLSLGSIAIATIFLGQPKASADIVVWADTNATVTVNPVGGVNRFDVVIEQNSNGSCLVGLDSDSSTDTIQLITFKNNPSLSAQQCLLAIRKPGDPIVRSSISSVEEIIADDPAEMLLTLSSLAIDGSIGFFLSTREIRVSACNLIDIGGDWAADVIINDERPEPSPVDLTLANADGDMLNGSLINNTGNIDVFSIGGAAINFDTGPFEVWSKGSIGSVEIGSLAVLDIGRNSRGFSGTPDVDLIDIGGLFAATSSVITLTLNSLNDMIIEGTYDANINILSAMNTTSLYDIGESLASTGSISLPANGLAGQIVINSYDGASNWSGDVIVDKTTLAANYTNTPASLGGGSVGIVSFSIHDNASVPVSNASTQYASSAAPPDATVEYYGPVSLVGAAPHFTIMRKLDNGDAACTFVDVTGDFTAAVVAGSQDRAVRFTPTTGTLDLVYQYEVTPIAGKVVNSGIAGSPDVSTEKYTFTLGSTLEPDLDADGVVGSSDLAELLAAWGTSCVRPDLDGSSVGSSDLAILLAAWTPSGSVMAGDDGPKRSSTSLGLDDPALGMGNAVGSGTGNPVLDYLGFSSIESYTDWLAALNDAQLSAHLVDLIEFVQAN